MMRLRQYTCIDKAALIAQDLKETYDMDVKEHRIRIELRRRLGLKFKRIKKIPFQGNSEKNLVLRQQFAMKLM